MINTPYGHTAFLGPIGGPELIMIFAVLFLLAIPAVIIIGIVMYSKSRSKAAQLPPPLTSVQGRLAEIDSLRSRNLITDVEYQEKRKQIIGDI